MFLVEKSRLEKRMILKKECQQLCLVKKQRFFKCLHFYRSKLFNQSFDPYVDENWRVLMVAKVGIIEHIMKEISQTIYNMQNNVETLDATIKKEYFFTSSNIKNERKLCS